MFWRCSQGSAIGGERTLQDFSEAVRPFAAAFMALFGRSRFPQPRYSVAFEPRSPLSPVEALRILFLEDLLARHLSAEERAAGEPAFWSVMWTGHEKRRVNEGDHRQGTRLSPQLRLRPL